ncbi:DUF4430 domain-containing protein [Gemmiger sp.]|uniref:DUF4430 domain-containing protein n=1 Tax=Gemmiger sp. TaxID=2049027 RepID=UPI002A75FF58|nr:DUF4430 domain-containing protein [Gemmiger sp.]MDY2694998.1 DUF4430 domain-containing protein [Gemmiger sp.]
MKKLISVIASLALAACLLAACGNSASSAASESVSSEAVSSEVVSSEAVSSEAVSSEAVSSEAVSGEESSEAAAEATFTVVDADGNSTEIALSITEGEKLSDALVAAGVISKEEAAAGFVTTVNGVTADYNADGAWWCLTDAAGEMTTVGVADIELHNGDSYAFTYTK